jgi:ubiquinone/menaquinone biosynthesis C-methylase UbiE
MAARFAREGALVTAVDIDEPAILAARERFKDIENLEFRVDDAMALDLPDASIDIALCCHVYEHVPDAARMMKEIRRVLRPGGLCYFSAGNRFTWREPHYGLPMLSVIPPTLAHWYLRLTGRGDFYHEQHRGYQGLRRLVSGMDLLDYTAPILEDPAKFGADYMIRPGSLTQHAACAVLNLIPHVFPNFIWLLKRPIEDETTT